MLFGLCIALAVVLGAGALAGLFDGLDADLDVDAEVDVEGDAAGSGATPWATWFGVGRAPLGVLLSAALLVFGGTGLALSSLISPWVALVGATTLSGATTSLIGRSIARWAPTAETYVVDRSALIGCAGSARIRVDDAFGVAHVRDRSGSLHEVSCRSSDPLPAGSAVVVVAYDDEAKRFEVVPLETPTC